MRSKKHKLADAIKLALAVNAGILSAATAQQSIAQDEQELEEIIVTGSRIPRRDLSGPSPVSIYNRANIEQSGATSIGQMLREIPAVAGGAQTTAINNGGSGSQNISLRGLGSSRTLVLINGRRAPDSSGGNGGLVDLNTIPVAMVERIEVLKDGASATYGSDAIAGVVNIILRDDFDGIDFSLQTGRSDASDGEKHEASVTIGDTFDGGNYVLSLTRVEESETIAGNRDWARQAKFLLRGEWVDGGSSAPPWGQYDQMTLGPDYNGDGMGGLRPFSFATDTYNYAPINFQRQPNERWILNASANSDVEALSNLGFMEETSVFGEISYIDRESEQALAEQPLAPLAFYGFEDATYSADNEYNITGVDIRDWRRRLVEDGPRTGLTEIQTFRGVAGFEGTFTNNISWEAYYNYSEVDYANNYGPLFNLHKVGAAVGPTVRDSDGTLRCDTQNDGVFNSDDDQDCVPLNTFGQGSITPEMVDYIAFRQNETNKVTQEVFAFNLTKPDLFALPAGDVGLAAGISRRQETGKFTPDALVAELAETGAVTGTPSDVTDGGYEVDEFFLEARVPILETLELELGWRYSDYDTFGTTDNWKAGVQFRPTDELLIRGSASTSFRAPTIANLFGGAGISFPAVSDPCASNPTQNCINNGVPAEGFTQISAQVRTLVGGSESTQPEEADTFTVGFVYQPEWLPGAAVTVDYYDIEIADPITSVGASVILSQCAQTGEFCDLIERFGPGTPNHGAPILIDNRTTNAGALETTGIDMLAEYRDIETSFGTFGVRWEATNLLEYDKTQANGTIVPHDGFFRDDEDGHFAEWRWTLSGLWENGPWSLQADYRYIDEVTEFGSDLDGSCVDGDGNVSRPGVNVGLTCVAAGSSFADTNLGDFVRTIDDAVYVDLYGSYEWSDYLVIYAGVDNALDEDPPLSVDGFNDNTDVRTFDTIGRYFYLGLRTSF